MDELDRMFIADDDDDEQEIRKRRKKKRKLEDGNYTKFFYQFYCEL